MDDEAALPVLSADKQETIFETVESLSHAAKDRLYAMGESSPWTARAVMQMLPALAQGVVLRLLCVDDPVDRADVEGWAAGDTSRLPDGLKDITKISNLVNPPNLDSYVFCVATRDCPPINVEGSTDVIEISQGEVALLSYAPLRPLLAEGAVLLA